MLKLKKKFRRQKFKACQVAFRTEFGERRAPSKCCVQKLVKKLETRGSRPNTCRLYSLGPIEGQSVQKYIPHNRTTQRRYTPRGSSCQRRHFGKSIPEFAETHSSVLGCERRPVSASIMSRSCFASFPVCVYKFSSHYLNNIIFYRQLFGASSERLTLCKCLSVWSMEYCTGLFVWGLQVCAHLVVGGVCVVGVHGGGLSPHTNIPVQYSIDRTDKHLHNTACSHYTHAS